MGLFFWVLNPIIICECYGYGKYFGQFDRSNRRSYLWVLYNSVVFGKRISIRAQGEMRKCYEVNFFRSNVFSRCLGRFTLDHPLGLS